MKKLLFHLFFSLPIPRLPEGKAGGGGGGIPYPVITVIRWGHARMRYMEVSWEQKKKKACSIAQGIPSPSVLQKNVYPE